LDDGKLVVARQQSSLLKNLAAILGLLLDTPDKFLKSGVDVIAIEKLIELRNSARKNKNWKEADKVRDELIAMGIALEDMPSGTSWVVEGKNKYFKHYDKD
ncbi:MAG: hypothetical protein KKE11_00385, partial [Gammaproteobacteria bacterium]|nr:hypothetical protein [Gammaproteobacteria bacterium]